ncbi:VCBS domain-containing protein [Candidatus Sumerlaeota bacterium]|nr:VCBS domain-containing protein [Candidatus Sumerlaeota bacterium]
MNTDFRNADSVAHLQRGIEVQKKKITNVPSARTWIALMTGLGERRRGAVRLLPALAALALFAALQAHAAPQTYDWNSGAGVWSDAANWTPAVVPQDNATTKSNVLIDNGESTASVATVGLNVTITTATVDFGDALAVTTGPLTIVSLFTNNGQTTVGGSLTSSVLIMGSGSDLTGSGSVVLSGGLLELTSGSFTHGASHTIQGSGALVNETGDIDNLGTVTANVPGGNILLNTDIISTNSGILGAENEGILYIDDTFLANSAGLIQALTSGTVSLQNQVTIDGGAMSTVGGGSLIDIAGTLNFLPNVSFSGQMISEISSSARLYNVFTNNGLWRALLNSIIYIDTDVSLNGVGEIHLEGGVIEGFGGGSDDILTVGANQTISGSGAFMNQTANFNNLGLVTANTSGGNILVDDDTYSTNSGIMRAENSGILYIDDSYITNTSGTIQALTSGTVIVVSQTTLIEGLLNTIGGGSSIYINGTGNLFEENALSGLMISDAASFVRLVDSFTNNGLWRALLNSMIVIDETVSLDGNGEIQLEGGVIEGFAGSVATDILIVGANQTISGFGAFMNQTANFNNLGVVTADASGSNILLDVDTYSTNSGIMRAENSGILYIDDSYITNTSGTIQALTSGTVNIVSQTALIEGLLNTVGGGSSIHINSTGNLFRANTLGSGLLISDPSSFVRLVDSFTNNGLWRALLNSSIFIDELVSLDGNGEIHLEGGVIEGFSGSVDPDILIVGANQTISGFGTFMNETAHFDNRGVITADTSGWNIFVDADAASTNTGTIGAENSGILYFEDTTLENTGGVIQALTSGTTILTINMLIGGGDFYSDGAGSSIHIAGGNNTLANNTLDGLMISDAGSSVTVVNAFDNIGLWRVLSNASWYIYNSLALNGAGEIRLEGGVIEGSAAAIGPNILTVAIGQAITGAGAFMNQTARFVNYGTVTADVPTSDMLVEADGPSVNNGRIGAENSGILYLNNFTLDNAGGDIQASTSGTVTIVDDMIITGGDFIATDAGSSIHITGAGNFLTSNTLMGLMISDSPSTVSVANTFTNNGLWRALLNASIGVYNVLSLDGVGEVHLEGGVIEGSAAAVGPNILIVGANQNITGSGAFMNQTASFVNLGTVVANTSGGNILVDADAPSFNTGLMGAQNDSTLYLDDLTLDNTGGDIQASTSGVVELLDNVIITGGDFIATDTGSSINIAGIGNFLANNTLTGDMISDSASAVHVVNAFTNNGLWRALINSSIGVYNSLSLDGTGEVRLEGGALEGSAAAIGPNILTIGADQSITGEGAFMNQTASFINFGSVIADAAGGNIVVDADALSTNTGSMGAQNESVMYIRDTAIENAGGVISALTSGVVVLEDDFIIANGEFSADATGYFEITGVFSALSEVLVNAPVEQQAGSDVQLTTGITSNELWRMNGGRLAISGSVLWDGSAAIEMHAGALIDGDAATLTPDILTIPAGKEIYGAGDLMGATAGMVNNGLIRANDSAGPLYLNPDAAAGFTNTGTLQADSTGELILDNGAAGFTNFNAGTGTLTGGIYNVYGRMEFTGLNLEVNQSEILIDGAGATFENSSGVRVTNLFQENGANGSFTLDNSAVMHTNMPLINNGAFTIGDGALFQANDTYNQAASTTTLNNGSLDVFNGATVNGGLFIGAGTVIGDLTSSGGLLNPGNTTGTLTVTGDFISEAGGTVAFHLGGYTAGTEFNQMSVGGAITLNGGTVTVDCFNGFTPALHDDFLLIAGPQPTGIFDNLIVTGGPIGVPVHLYCTPSGVHLGFMDIYAVDDTISTPVLEDELLTIIETDYLGNDISTSPPLVLVSVDGRTNYGAELTLGAGNVLTYDPRNPALIQILNDGDSIVDTFTYTITDNTGTTETATVSITVLGVDERALTDAANNLTFPLDEPLAVDFIGEGVDSAQTIGMFFLDIDTNGDGVPNFMQSSDTDDMDGDGQLNGVDADDDNDGIPDVDDRAGYNVPAGPAAGWAPESYDTTPADAFTSGFEAAMNGLHPGDFWQFVPNNIVDYTDINSNTFTGVFAHPGAYLYVDQLDATGAMYSDGIPDILQAPNDVLPPMALDQGFITTELDGVTTAPGLLGRFGVNAWTGSTVFYHMEDDNDAALSTEWSALSPYAGAYTDSSTATEGWPDYLLYGTTVEGAGAIPWPLQNDDPNGERYWRYRLTESAIPGAQREMVFFTTVYWNSGGNDVNTYYTKARFNPDAAANATVNAATTGDNYGGTGFPDWFPDFADSFEHDMMTSVIYTLGWTDVTDPDPFNGGLPTQAVAPATQAEINALENYTQDWRVQQNVAVADWLTALPLDGNATLLSRYGIDLAATTDNVVLRASHGRQPHAMAYVPAGEVGAVIAFEEEFDGGDRDFNDTAILLRRLQPFLDALKSVSFVNDADGDGYADSGDVLQYDIVLTNYGGSVLTPTTLTDVLDVNLTLVGGSLTIASSVPAPYTVLSGNGAGNPSVIIEWPTVPRLSVTTVTFTATVDAPLTPPTGSIVISNQGFFTGGEPDPVPTDNPLTLAVDDPTTIQADAEPDVNPEFYTTDEDTPFSDPVGVLANDSDYPYTTATLSVVAYDATSANGAAVTITAGGSLTYDPTVSASLQTMPEGAVTVDTFNYTVSDNNGNTAVGLVTVTVDGVNDWPTDITIDNDNIPETSPIGTLVGNFSTADVDLGDSHVYSLVPGDGDRDNAAFVTSGTQLITNTTFDYPTQFLYRIRVRTTDLLGLWYEEEMIIWITQDYTPPYDNSLNHTYSVTEDTFTWLDITTIATQQFDTLGDDQLIEIPLGMDFTFFGQTYTTAYISGNGTLFFGGVGPASWINGANPQGTHPEQNDGLIYQNYNGPMIAAAWDDWDVSDYGSYFEGNIYTTLTTFEGRQVFVIQYEGVLRVDGTNADSFQIMLFADRGDIRINYRDMDSTHRNGMAIGIEGDSATYVQYTFEEAPGPGPTTPDDISLLFRLNARSRLYSYDVADGGETDMTTLTMFIQFDIAVDLFTADDIICSNCEVTTLTQITDNLWSFVVQNLAPGLVTIYVPGGAVVSNGQRSSPSNIFTYTYNPGAVTVTLSSPDVSNGGNYGGESPVDMTATFNRDVTGFTIGDIVVTNAAVQGFTAVSARVYTFQVIPIAQGGVTVLIPAGAATGVAPPTDPNVASLVYSFNFTAAQALESSLGAHNWDMLE